MTGDFDRAVADHLAGRLEEAAAVYRRILDSDPSHADAWHLLGLSLHQRGRHELAVSAVRRALLLNPRIANYHNSLGLALHAGGDSEGAVQALQTAVVLDGNDADAFNNLGMVLTDLRRFEEAERALRRSLAIRSDHQGAIYNLGRVLAWLGRDEEAVAQLEEACRMGPGNPAYWNTLGVALTQIHDFEGGLNAFEQAIGIDPTRIDPHINRAHAWLREGRFEAGWKEHEWRLRGPTFRHRMETEPWRGEDIAGKSIRLWAEQGLGDAIHFARYAPLVAERGARIVLECPVALHGILRTIRGIDEVVAPGAIAPDCDTHAALMSLPCVFGVPKTVEPYIGMPPAATLPGGGNRRVGLVWAGNPAHSNDRNRSYSLASLAPLAAVDAELYALQVGDAAGEPAPEGMALHRLGDGFSDFTDTAAALAALDLLIAVDTSVAHLAGAMGVPTWLLLPSCPDWRWGLSGETTRWYPGMKLFRQAPGEPKNAVVARLTKALAEG